MPTTLVQSARILVGRELTNANILIEDGTIKRITRLKPTTDVDLKIDASGLIALPGLIDAHVHLRDLELSYKETYESGTQAAAVGGFTTVLDMPNTRPPTTSYANLADKMSKAERRLYANVGFQGALVEDVLEMKKMVQQGAIAFKLYMNKALETFNSSAEAELEKAMQAAKASKALVTVHAEDGTAIREIQKKLQAEGKAAISDFLKAHRPEMEVAAVRRILSLGRKLAMPVHICHITVPAAVRLVKRTPRATCEASAHHLLLNESVFRKHGTLATCVPPIRSERYRQGLWQLFSAGQVDILASDHAPHTLEEKTNTDAWRVASGVPGLETSLPVLFTQVSKGRLTFPRLIESMATLPAKIFRLKRKGALKEGFDADIVLLDPKAKFEVRPEDFLSKAKYSPFRGMRCVGRAEYTIVNGTLVAERGRIVGPPAGRVVKSDR